MGLLQRTRRARLVVLSAALAATLAFAGWRQVEMAFARTPFEGPLDAGHGVVVERVRLLRPPATLCVARVPRGAGLRLRAVMTSAAPPALEPVAVAARREGALVAINGDYHRLDGVCEGWPYSSLVDGALEDAPTLGSPFGYACALWLDREGVPRVGPLDLGARVRFASGGALPVFVNLETGNDLLISRPPRGAWSADASGVPLERAGPTTFRVTGGPATSFQGPALLRRGGFDAQALLEAAPGAALTLEPTGGDAGRVALAIGTGPRLLEGGRVAAVLDDPQDQGWTAKVPRAAVGVSPAHVLLVTTFHLPRHGLSLVDFARALAQVGCVDAVNLDGGPSPTLWATGLVRNGERQDEEGMPVATTLLVLPPDGTPGLR